MQERVKHATKMKERKSLEGHHYIQIGKLKPGMKMISLRGRVIEISKPKSVLTRFFDCVVFANATLADETGKINLALENARIEMISVNDMVQIENADVIMFGGEKQLRTGRNGRFKVVETSPIRGIQ